MKCNGEVLYMYVSPYGDGTSSELNLGALDDLREKKGNNLTSGNRQANPHYQAF